MMHALNGGSQLVCAEFGRLKRDPVAAIYTIYR